MKLETRSSENYFSFLFKSKIPLIKKIINFRLMFYKTPDVWVHGYSSRTEKGLYVLFHDYDSMALPDIVQELKFLQEKFHLSDYYVFRLDKENSYHAVCLDAFRLKDAYDIQIMTSCDLAFIHSIKRLKTKEWVLRLSEKGKRHAPEYFMKIKSEGIHEKSSAHATILRKFGCPVDRKGQWDHRKRIKLVKYNTFNRVD